MLINSYHFGSIVINGNTYSSDVIIYPDRDMVTGGGNRDTSCILKT